MNTTMEPEAETQERPRRPTPDIRLATPASIKTNGWERFMTWVQEGGIVLLAKRITEGGVGHDRVARHPILAAAVNTDWVNKITKKGTADRAEETLTMASAEARADFRGLSSKVYMDAADGHDVHVMVRSYHRSGTRAADHPNVVVSDGFTIVPLAWLAQALNTSEKSFYDVEERLPWITPRKPRAKRTTRTDKTD